MKDMKNLLILVVGLTVPVSEAFAEKYDIGDEQIADIVVVANHLVIEAGKLAYSTSLNDEVKAYAHRTIGEHTKVSKSVAELINSLRLTPHDNPISNELRVGGEKNLAKLRTTIIEEFDKAYIDQKIAFHQNLLDMIDNRLMPAAQAYELKALLFSLFSPFSDHLEHAQQIQESLNNTRKAETDL